jgi:hypothetical protein
MSDDWVKTGEGLVRNRGDWAGVSASLLELRPGGEYRGQIMGG